MALHKKRTDCKTQTKEESFFRIFISNLSKSENLSHSLIKFKFHFTVVDLVSQPSRECESDDDLVLIQTSSALLWKVSLKKYYSS